MDVQNTKTYEPQSIIRQRQKAGESHKCQIRYQIQQSSKVQMRHKNLQCSPFQNG